MSTLLPPFEPPGSADVGDFGRLDMRVGRIIDAAPRGGSSKRRSRARRDGRRNGPLLGTETDAEPGLRIA